MKPTFLILLFSFISSFSFGQGEANVWYFGDSAGLDFNTSPPSILENSHMRTGEGCASIATSDGKLLFYTNGISVWDSTHNIMPNGTGLHGSTNSTQSAVIVKMNNILYMIITADYTHGQYGLEYNIIDMSLNNGKGDVKVKNIIINSTLHAEKIGIAEYADSSGFWIISKHSTASIYYSYLVINGVVNLTPVVSVVGDLSVLGEGYMKVSPNQKKIAVANYTKGIEVYDFNKYTGKLSNAVTLTGTSSFTGCYGLEFSSNSKFLYYHKPLPYPSIWDNIIQCNVSLPSSNAIINSQIVIGALDSVIGAFQMASDGKIYITQQGGNYLSAIRNPSIAGPFCNLVEYEIGPFQNKTQHGLPGFFSSYLPMSGVKHTQTCLGDSTVFSLRGMGSYDSLKWNFDDPSSGNANFSLSVAPKHVFSDTGVFFVKLLMYKNNIVDSIIDKTTVVKTLAVSLGADTTICDGQKVRFDFSSSNFDMVLWNSVDEGNVFSLEDSGLHYVDVYKHGCVMRDTIKISVNPAHLFSLGKDTFVCAGDSLTLNIGSGADSYLWSNNDKDSFIKVGSTGTFSVEARINSCYTYDTINMDYRDKPTFSFGEDTVICENEEIIFAPFNVGIGYEFLWNDGVTLPYKVIKSNDTVSLKVIKKGCYWSDTVIVLKKEYFEINFADTVSCSGDTLRINIGSGAETYSWSNGITDSIGIFTQTGKYYVQAANGNCISEDSIDIDFYPKPLFNLGTDTTICNTDSITLTGTSGVKHLWNAGDTTQNLTVKTAGEYILTQNTQFCEWIDTIQVSVQQQPSLNIGNDTVVCIGEKVIMGNTIPNGIQYTWNNRGDATPKITTDSQSTYSVIAYDGVCRAYDTLFVGVYTPQSMELGLDSTLCAGTETLLDATINRGKYLWNDGLQTPTRLITQPGNYSVLVTDSVCQYSDAITINFSPVPPLELGPDTFLCQDEVHQVFVDPQWESVMWSDGSTANNRIFTTEGKYVVTAGYLNCQATDSIGINYYPPLPTLDLGADQDVCDPLFYPVQANYNGYYPLIWNTGAKGNYIEITQTGDYIVSTAPHRCGQVSDTIHITFLKELCDLHIPTAFSPNGDGRNDVFFPIGYQVDLENMKIYNRWGELLFDGVTPWDGIYKGEPVPAGNYLYVITYKKEHRGGKKRVFTKGTVQVIK